MNFRSLRPILTPLAFLAVVALADRAYASPPPVSCQSQAPHHTATLGPHVDFVSLTSDKAYWDNECGCYIAQFDVPSTSSPASAHLYTSFDIVQKEAIPDFKTKEQCESYEERLYLYKKVNGAFVLHGGSTSKASWIHSTSGPYCALANRPYLPRSLTPPAAGSDTYRVLHSLKYGAGFHHVTIEAVHEHPMPR